VTLVSGLVQAVEYARCIFWLGGVKCDLNQTLVSSGLVLLMFVIFINCCLGFILCWHLIIHTFVLLVPAK